MATKVQTKQRGAFLTVMLVLGAIGFFESLYAFTNTNAAQITYGPNLPSWYPIYLVVALGLSVATVVGIWLWKKWGAYAIGASTVIGLFLQLFILKPINPNVNLFAYVGVLISAGLWFWAISRKWQYFE